MRMMHVEISKEKLAGVRNPCNLQPILLFKDYVDHFVKYETLDCINEYDDKFTFDVVLIKQGEDVQKIKEKLREVSKVEEAADDDD